MDSRPPILAACTNRLAECAPWNSWVWHLPTIAVARKQRVDSGRDTRLHAGPSYMAQQR